MTRQFPVKGLGELNRFLDAFPARLQRQAIRQALTAAAAPIRDEARLRAPKATGQMARAIKTGSPRQNQDGTFSVSVRLDPRSKHAYLGYFAEYGVGAHLIASKKSKRGRASLKAAVAKGDRVAGVIRIGDRYVSGVISHPGHAAHPFLRPALDIRADAAIDAFAAKIRDFIEGKTGLSLGGADLLDEAA